MKRTGSTAVWAAVALLAGAQPAAAQVTAADAEKLALGKQLSSECTTCHRADGRSSSIPPIVGLEPDYFVTTMKFYKSGARDNPVMNSVAAMLDDEQMQALAAYLATQKPAKPAPPSRKK